MHVVLRRLFLYGLIITYSLPIMVAAAQPEPEPLYALPAAFNNPAVTSGSMTISQRGRLIVANPLANTVSVVDVLNRNLDVEVRVGVEPRNVALTPDNLTLLVSNYGDGTLTVIDTVEFETVAVYSVGSLPQGVVVAPDGTSAYVARYGNSDVVRIDLATGLIEDVISTPAAPVGLAQWGEFLYVTHLWSGEISLIYRPTARLIQTTRLHPQASHAHNITIDTLNGLAYIPYSIANTRARFAEQAFVPRIAVVDLAQMAILPDETIDLTTADRWLNIPHDLAFDVTNNTLFVVSSASNGLTILGRNDPTAQAHLPTDTAPQTVIAGRDGISIYVHNIIAQTVGIYETRFNTLTDTIPTSQSDVDSATRLAATAFYNTLDARTPACAACHYDGMSDGRTWGIDQFARNTPSLLLSPSDALGWQSQWQPATITAHPMLAPPFTPNADNTSLGALPADAMDAAALVTYLQAFQAPLSPNPVDAATLTQGSVLYETLGCAACHDGDPTTLYDVGTGGEFRAPPLRALWLSAPYGHDGSIPDLPALLLRGQGIHRLSSEVSDADIDALITYLLARD